MALFVESRTEAIRLINIGKQRVASTVSVPDRLRQHDLSSLGRGIYDGADQLIGFLPIGLGDFVELSDIAGGVGIEQTDAEIQSDNSGTGIVECANNFGEVF